MDFNRDGLGVVFSGALYLVPRDDSWDGVEVDSTRAGSDYAGDGNDTDFC